MSDFLTDRIIKLQKKINYFFEDLSLLETALTHSSYYKIQYNYERLEFLGDSIIGSIVSEWLFLKFNNKKEGYLTKQKSLIVNKKNLAFISNKLDLIRYAKIGDSIDYSNKASMIRISADLYESLIGAIFLDSNYEIVKEFIYSNLLDDRHSPNTINNKGALIELFSKNKIKKPKFFLINESLVDNNKVFEVELRIENQIFFGNGSKIKEAEDNAACKALDFFCV